MKTFKDQLQLFMVSSECVKDLSKWDNETAEINTTGQSIV